MSFLDKMINKGKAKLDEFTHQNQNQNQPPQPNYASRPPPPPINYASKPSSFAPPVPSRPSASPQNQLRPYWQPTFSPQTPVSSIFVQETGAHGWGNNELENYTNSPQNSFFTPNSQLVIRAISNPSAPNDKYTSARLYTHETLNRPRGYVTATLHLPSSVGIWPAFWLLPKEPFTWPNEGEIDIAEVWNGEGMNHSCLHWGHYNGEDWDKHRVLDTPIYDLTIGQQTREHVFGLGWWDERGDGGGWDEGRGGKLVWYIDGRAVMKAAVPRGMRRLEEWRAILNVAMGGNVCQGKIPGEGTWDLVVRDLMFCEEPVGGWGSFVREWEGAKEGRTM